MIEDVVESGVNGHLTGVEDSADEELKKLIAYFDDLFLLKGVVKESDLDNLDNEGIISYYKDAVMKAYAAKEEIVKDEMREIERVVLLRVVDTKWMDHIDSMEHLKQYIGLRSYKQQDPVQAYQFEGSAMFEEMIQNIKLDTVRYLYHIEIEKKEPQIERERVAVETTTNYDEAAANEPKKRTEPKIGRNDPCPCGSGKKYKNCCGRGK